MVKDRLNELREAANIKIVIEEDDDCDVQVSVKRPLKKKEKDKQASEGPLDVFFSQINIKENMEVLEQKVTEIKKLRASIMSSPYADESSRKALDEKVNEIQRLSKEIHEQLKKLDEKVKEDERANEESRKKGGGDVHQADLRMKKLQHSFLVEKFREKMTEYHENQLQYQEQMKSMFRRTLKIVNKDMSDAEIEEVLEGEGDNQLFAVLHLAEVQKAKLDLRELEERHQELLKLEKSIQQVMDLFVDIAVLVAEQGEKLDRIDTNILEAKDYVESARKQTEKAVSSRKKFRKRKCCLIGCIAVLVSFLVVAITLSIIFR